MQQSFLLSESKKVCVQLVKHNFWASETNQGAFHVNSTPKVTLTNSPVRHENNSRSIKLNEITVIFHLFKPILTPIRQENFSSTPKIFGPKCIKCTLGNK